MEQGRRWSFDGDGCRFRLVSKVRRIRLAFLSNPVLAGSVLGMREFGRERAPLAAYLMPVQGPVAD